MLTFDNREKVMNMLISICLNSCSDLQKITHVVKEIEMLCYKKADEQCKFDGRDDLFKERYSSAIGDIATNLDPISSSSSKWLINALMSGEITPDKIIKMKTYELNPERSAAELKKVNGRLNSKIERKVMENKTCRFCGAKKVYWFEQQIRSLDEPKTKFYECDECDRSWS